MKISRLEFVALLLAALCLAFTAGWFVRGAKTAAPVRIEVQRSYDAPAVEAPASPSAGPQETAAAAVGTVNINTADRETLQTLPGIGEKRAEDIIAYREAHGPFLRVSDLTRVKGIGAGILEELRPFVTIG